MKLLKIEAQDFGVFKQLELEMPTQPGLNLIVGKNLQDPKLGGNGVGKSTVFNAIVWCIYGKDSRKLFAESLLREDATKGYWVRLTFDEFVLYRSWKPNRFQLDGREVDPASDEIEKLIGMNQEQFLLCCLTSQTAKHFLSLGSTDKLAFLSKVYELDIWTDLASDAKKQEEQAQREQDKFEALAESASRQKFILDSRLEQVEQQIKDWEHQEIANKQLLLKEIESLTEQAATWSVALEANMAQIESELLIALDSEEKFDKDTEKEKTEITKLANAVQEDHTDEIEQLKQRVQKLDAKIATLDLDNLKTKLAIEEDRLKRAQAALEDIHTECPTCGQAVDQTQIIDHKQKEVKKTLVYRDSASHHVRHAESQMVDLKPKRDRLFDEYNLLIQEQKQRQANLDSFAKSLSLLKQRQNPYTGLVTQLEKQLETAKAVNPYFAIIKTTEQKLQQRPTNPYKDQNQDTQAQIKLLSDEQIEHKRQAGLQSQNVIDFNYWHTNYPLLRLWVLKKALTEMELHLNQALGKLGMPDYHISLSTERLQKNKSIANELTVTLTRNGKEKNIATLSGGERQRFNLAGAVGISDLVKHRLGVLWNLLMFDEPSLGLSKEGVEDMLELFANLGESDIVFLAEHRVDHYGVFNSVWELIKSVEGTSDIRKVA